MVTWDYMSGKILFKQKMKALIFVIALFAKVLPLSKVFYYCYIKGYYIWHS